MTRKAVAWITVLGLSAGISSSVCLGVPPEEKISEQVAVVTELPSAVEVTYLEISLRTDLPNSRLKIAASCAIRNEGKVPLDRLDFYLLGAEKLYGVEVDIAKIARLIGGRQTDVTFQRSMEQEPKDPSQARTFAYPEVTSVFLSPVLNEGEECRLVFDYVITCVDTTRAKGDKLICELEKGKKETCLIADFGWFPLVMADLQKTMGLVARKNFFPRLPKLSWRVTLTHPAGLQGMVIDGKLQKSEQVGEQMVSEWRSIVGGWPQVFIGPSERVEKSAEDVTVVFLLPSGKYNPEYVDALGDLVIHTYRVYTEWFGPLESNEVHIVATSGISGGHGAFLGMTVEASDFQKEMSENTNEAGEFFDQTAPHELAHSWWGGAVSSYGRGTKFLRESLANFSAWHLARQHYGTDFFKSTLRKKTFQKDWAKKSLFNAESDERGFSYTKGPIVLDILRREMGDEVFFRTLREFVRRNRNAYATFIDFVAICNEVSRRDWMPFFYQWCYGNGWAAYHLVGFESTEGRGGWETKVKIRNDGEAIVRCPLELRMNGKRQEETFWVQGGEEKTFVYQTDREVTDVVVDPNETVYQLNAKEDRMRIGEEEKPAAEDSGAQQVSEAPTPDRSTVTRVLNLDG